MLLAFLLYKFHLGEGVVSFGIIVIYVLAAFLAGYFKVYTIMRVPAVFEAQSNIFQSYSHSTGLYARFDASG